MLVSWGRCNPQRAMLQICAFAQHSPSQKTESLLNSLGDELGEMLLPDPTDQICRVVLILRKPKLALLADDVEYLSRSVSVMLF